MCLGSVGLYMNSECNKLTYNRTVEVKYLESFERDELELIFWISGLTILNINATMSSPRTNCTYKISIYAENQFCSKPIKKLLKVCSINVYEF